MSINVTLNATGRTYRLPERGEVDWNSGTSRYLTDLATVVNSIGSGSLVTPVFNVKNYGATGDGTTDDTVAITAARAALAATGNTGGTLYFPAGTYKFVSFMQFGVAVPQRNIKITGDGVASILKPTGSFGTNPVIEFRDCDKWEITGIKIDASARSGTGDNIHIDGCSNGVCTDATIINATGYGIRVDQNLGSTPPVGNAIYATVMSGNSAGDVLASGTAATITLNGSASLSTDSRSKIVAFENGTLGRHLSKETGFYDIRDWGAIPGSAGQTATTAAFNAIFAEISYSYFPTVNGKRSATIYVPSTDQDGWYIGDLNAYVGSPGANIHFKGDSESGRSGLEGSTIVFNGSTGGTMFDFKAINGSLIENLTFNLNSKALVGIKLHQYWNIPNTSQVGSSGVLMRHCFLHSPKNDYDSILVQAGSDDDNPNTLQSSEYRFEHVDFQGVDFGTGIGATKQGWGFKAVVSGNTKNFVFENCSFVALHRGIEATSGYLLVKECNGANIGFDRADSSLVVSAGNTCSLITAGVENGNVGYAARLLQTSQGTCTRVDGCYMAGNTPLDDYAIVLGGPSLVTACNLGGNSRASANTLAWTANTLVYVGQVRQNDSGKAYVCITQGTTANSGGPTGTGSGIVDGTAHWDYVTSTLTGNVLKIQAFLTEPAQAWGGVIVEGCTFPCTSTPVSEVPIYDGSNNPIGVSIAKDNTDFNKNNPHYVRAFGNSTGIFGADINTPLPDFTGSEVIWAAEQYLNDNATAGITIIRNGGGCYTVTIPYTVVQAGATVTLGKLPLKFALEDCVMDVTETFTGGTLSAMTAKVGNSATSTNGILLAQDVFTATAQFGRTAAEHGADLTTDGRYVVWSGINTLQVTFTPTGDTVNHLTQGSLTLYLRGTKL